MKYLIKGICILFLLVGCSGSDGGDDNPTLKSSEKKLLSFSVKEFTDSFVISGSTVETTLTEEKDVSSLTAVFTASSKAKVYVGSTIQNSGSSKNDFTNPVTYKVVAEDGTSANYVVTIHTVAQLKTFSIVELGGVNFNINDAEITAEVPAGTVISNLTAKFTITDGADLYVNNIKQVSEVTKNNFEQPIVYQLKQDSEVVKEYTVTITVVENNTPIADAGEDKLIIIPQGTTEGTVTLDASGSFDEEGDISAYEWKINSTVIAETATANVNLALGVHNITLTVTDALDATDSDEVTVEVRLQGEYIPVDSGATQETKNLYNNIATIANSSQFAFGQEFPLSFRLGSLRSDLSTSDCYDVTGDHPGVYGIDPHYMLYKTSEQKQTHIDEAKHAYNNGSIVTFDFHQQSKTDNKIYFDELTSATDKSLMYDIVNDFNGSRNWFNGEMDQIIDIINNDLGFPIVFRLYHEMDGDWFWWGTDATNHSTQLYIDFYRLAVEYIKERTDLVLFAWSPNQQLDESYYPGDAYVDVVGIDMYNPVTATLKDNLIELSTFADNHGKVAALTETGKSNYVNLTPTFWTSNILGAIEAGGSDIKIAWALAWFNAPWHSSQNDLYIPDSNSSTTVKNDFIEFYNSNTTLFQQEVKSLNIYN
jgi:hypothetical protein